MSKLKPIEVPEIRFHNAWLLTDAFVTYTKQIEKFKDRPVPSWEGFKRIDKTRRSGGRRKGNSHRNAKDCWSKFLQIS